MDKELARKRDSFFRRLGACQCSVDQRVEGAEKEYKSYSFSTCSPHCGVNESRKAAYNAQLQTMYNTERRDECRMAGFPY